MPFDYQGQSQRSDVNTPERHPAASGTQNKMILCTAWALTKNHGLWG